jgi:DNA-binding transcriptional ArsR family regulator
MVKSDPPLNENWADIAAVDKLIHEPARLAAMSILDAVESADFLYLQRATGLTKGNLSVHLQKLEEAGLIEIQKTFQGKYPRTLCKLTVKGKEDFGKYKEQIQGVFGSGA